MTGQVVRYHLIFSIIFILASLLWGSPLRTISVALGCAVVGINLPLVFWSWTRIFQKKSVALAVGVIVFKYAILGVIIYLVTSRPDLDGIGFLIGLISLVPTMILFSLRNFKKDV